MDKLPQISIAMCTYNGSSFVREQLDSVIAQSFEDWEIVIIDDCSSDETWGILDDYAAQDKRFRIFCNDKNLGYNKNFEKALRLCRGEYIAICDQDDNQLIYHDSEFIDRSGKSIHQRISEKFNFYRGSRPEAFLYFNCVSGHSILMRRTLLEKALPFPSDFHYDQWLAFNAANTGSIDFIGEPLVYYRQHDNNNTDLLALHTPEKSKAEKIISLERESYWLLQCAGQTSGTTKILISELYEMSINRNSSFVNLHYGFTIWKNRQLLLALLKKNDVSKFFFSLRKAWGAKAKMIA
jgi:glycosyltransferase involved in cell wall biosynthesis